MFIVVSIDPDGTKRVVGRYLYDTEEKAIDAANNQKEILYKMLPTTKMKIIVCEVKE